jgi:hypothetical protein
VLATVKILRSTSSSKPVLKPDVFQNFELTEKTVLSHNTAM